MLLVLIVYLSFVFEESFFPPLVITHTHTHSALVWAAESDKNSEIYSITVTRDTVYEAVGMHFSIFTVCSP